jgi:hypothetical protein
VLNVVEDLAINGTPFARDFEGILAIGSSLSRGVNH